MYEAAKKQLLHLLFDERIGEESEWPDARMRIPLKQSFALFVLGDEDSFKSCLSPEVGSLHNTD